MSENPVVQESAEPQPEEQGPQSPAQDIDVIDPVPNEVTLLSGFVVDIRPLRAREFFKLIRILTRGAAVQLASFNFNVENSQEFGAQLLVSLLFAIPEAEDESIQFVQSMVEPHGLYKHQLSPAQKKYNDQQLEMMHKELNNPELEDLTEIISAVVRREAENLQALGKRIQAMWKLAVKTGQVPASPAANS